MIASFSSTLEALWCAHSIQEMSDPREMGSTLQAQLDSLEDSVNKLLTLSEVMSKLQRRIGKTPSLLDSLLKAISEGFLQSWGCFCESVPPRASGLCVLIDNGAFPSLPASSASLQGRSTGPMSDGDPLG